MTLDFIAPSARYARAMRRSLILAALYACAARLCVDEPCRGVEKAADVRAEAQNVIVMTDERLRQDNKDADAYYKRGVARGRLDQRELAIKDYSDAIRLDPTMWCAYNNRAWEYMEVGRLDAAEMDAREAVKLAPNNPEPYITYANLFRRQGEPNLALAMLDGADEVDPGNTTALNERGIIYRMEGQYAESVEVFNRAIKLDPSDPLLYNNRGNSWRDARRLKDAIADYNHAIALDPLYARAYKNRGVTYELLGDAESAAKDRDRFNELRARASR